MCGFMFDNSSDDEDDRFVGRECYVFNKNMDLFQNDERCEHCRFYLTVHCKHIHEFVDEEGDV